MGRKLNSHYYASMPCLCKATPLFTTGLVIPAPEKSELNVCAAKRLFVPAVYIQFYLILYETNKKNYYFNSI